MTALQPVHNNMKAGTVWPCIYTYRPLVLLTLLYSFLFKLVDFGTACELDPEEIFIELAYGTEEYDIMYERALTNPQKKEQFSAKVFVTIQHLLCLDHHLYSYVSDSPKYNTTRCKL